MCDNRIWILSLILWFLISHWKLCPCNYWNNLHWRSWRIFSLVFSFRILHCCHWYPCGWLNSEVILLQTQTSMDAIEQSLQMSWYHIKNNYCHPHCLHSINHTFDWISIVTPLCCCFHNLICPHCPVHTFGIEYHFLYNHSPYIE